MKQIADWSMIVLPQNTGEFDIDELYADHYRQCLEISSLLAIQTSNLTFDDSETKTGIIHLEIDELNPIVEKLFYKTTYKRINGFVQSNILRQSSFVERMAEFLDSEEEHVPKLDLYILFKFIDDTVCVHKYRTISVDLNLCSRHKYEDTALINARTMIKGYSPAPFVDSSFIAVNYETFTETETFTSLVLEVTEILEGTVFQDFEYVHNQTAWILEALNENDL